MGTFLHDIRYSLRTLRKNPGFTLVVTLALALGIGANTLIFSVVNAVLLRPLPFDDPERLAMIWGEVRGERRSPTSYADLVDLRQQATSVAKLAGFGRTATFITDGGEPEPVRGCVASADLFPVLGAQAAIGRVFTAEEDRPGGGQVVLLSDGLWRRRYGADRGIIGRTVSFDEKPVTVLGVMPPGFQFPLQGNPVDYWVPLETNITESRRQQRGSHWMQLIGRLRPEVSYEQAAGELRALSEKYSKEFPSSNTDYNFYPVSLHDDLVEKGRPALLVLVGAVVLVLLIACANVANLLLARASARQRELAIRSTLGASRGRIIRQLLSDTLVLAMLGGTAGLLLAWWGIDLLMASVPADGALIQRAGLDPTVLLFTLGISLGTGLIFGLAPALQATGRDLNDSLKEGGRGASDTGRRQTLRNALVVAEVALSLVLLIGAGLLIRSFIQLQEVDPGFHPEGVIVVDMPLSQTRYDTPEKQARFFEGVLERMRAIPGVESAAGTYMIPLSGNNQGSTFGIAGVDFGSGPSPEAGHRLVSPGYFRTMGIPLVRGRDFTDRDRAGAPPVVVVNQALADRYFEGKNPVGRRLEIGNGTNVQEWEIVGVVGNVRFTSLEEEARPEYFLPYSQRPEGRTAFVLRAPSAAPGALDVPLRAAVRETDPNQPVVSIRQMQALVDDSAAGRRFSTMLLVGFAAAALLLASLGIYGVIAYSVERRTHEIGIRMALGARRRDVLGMVVRQGMRLAGIGLAIGLVASFALTRLMTGLLYGVSPTDPGTYLLIPVFLAAVAFLACAIPARRAMNIHPMIALKYE